MKLLSKVSPVIDEDGISIKMKRVTKEMQANLIELTVNGDGLASRLKVVDYVLLNCIDSLNIDGVEYSAKEIAESADIGDDDTIKSLIKIGELVLSSCFLDEEDKKKSE